MLTQGFDPRRPFAITPPFARCFADDDAANAAAAAAADADVDDDKTDYKAKYLDEINSSKKYRKRAQDVEAERDKLAKLALEPEAAEEYERLKAEATEREQADADAEAARLAAEGDWKKLQQRETETHDAAMAQKDKSHKADLDKRDEENARLTGIVAKLGAENPLQAALSNAKVQDVSAAVFFIQNSPDSKYRVVSGLNEKGQPIPKVVDLAGADVVDPDSDGDMMTVESLVANFIGTDFGLRFLPASGDTGSGAVRGVSKPFAGITQAKLIADPDKHSDFIKEHGPDAFSKLPRK